MDGKLHGSGKWERALDRKFVAVERSTWKATAAAAHLIEREIKLTLRTYTHPEGTPTTSPPGQPPALVTGNLRRSIVVRGPRAGRKPYQVVAQVGPTAVYSRIQELGGRVRIRGRGEVGPQRERSYANLPARPYVRPTVNRVRRDVRHIYQRHWTKALLS